MAKIYYDNDANLEVLSGKTIAVIGYGNQGHAQAQNMRDSGLNVVVGLPPEHTEYWNRAKSDGMEVASVEDAAAAGDIIHILIPDTIQPEVYEAKIKPHLKEGNALGFSHGFNIRFKQIIPPEYVDVYMVAPKGPGTLVRTMYVEGKGVPCLVAVEQDYTGQAMQVALAHAKAIGGTRAGVIETTFAEETETDLFGEQTVLCGGVTSLIKAGFETLVEAGYQPEIAYFECLHELKLIVDLIYERGIWGMRQAVSDTAKYGDVTRGPRVISDAVKAEMKKILEEVVSGKFAEEWIAENKAGRPNFKRLLEQDKDHLIEQVGKNLRSMMDWLKE